MVDTEPLMVAEYLKRLVQEAYTMPMQSSSILTRPVRHHACLTLKFVNDY